MKYIYYFYLKTEGIFQTTQYKEPKTEVKNILEGIDS